MLSLLVGLVTILVGYRALANLLDLGLVKLLQWLTRRRIPQKMHQMRIELELHRSKIPEQVRAHCAHTGCEQVEEHIAAELQDFDAKLEDRLKGIEAGFREQVGNLRVTSGWQLFALLAAPDVRLQQFKHLHALILPSSRN